MKNFYILFLFTAQITLAQSFFNDFEDSNLQGWTNSDTSTDAVTIVENLPFHYLQKQADGSNTSIGEMAIINESPDFWVGDYFYIPVSGNGNDTLRNVDDITLKNSNNFDLYMRYAFEGSNGYQVVTTDPIIVPANSDWDIYGSFFGIENNTLSNLTVLTDVTGLTQEEIVANVIDLFSDVVMLKILHNEVPSFEGDHIAGSIELESIFSYELLANPDRSPELISIYPNPIDDVLFIKTSSNEHGSLELLNVLGKVVLTQPLLTEDTKIDTHQLNSGVYLASIKINGAVHTKKLVKL